MTHAGPKVCLVLALGLLTAAMSVAALGASPAAAPTPVDPAPWKVVDSGFSAVDRQIESVWIDNDRVLFRGVDVAATARADSQKPVYRMYLWNVRTNSIAPYTDRWISEICVDGALTTYAVSNPDSRIIYSGKLGEEVVVRYGDTSRINSFDCGILEYATQKPAWANERMDVQILRKGHGYLVSTPPYAAGKPNPDPPRIRLVTDSGAEKTLDIDPRSSAYPVSWSPVAQKYVLTDTRTERYWNVVWLLDPAGNVERVDLPRLDWSRPKAIHAIRDGFLLEIGTTSSSTSKSPGNSGIYVVRGGRLQRVMSGYTYALSVSPDGCRIAFGIIQGSSLEHAAGYRAWRRGEHANTLRHVDLCGAPS